MDVVTGTWAALRQAGAAGNAAELAIFIALLYWFLTSSLVADMVEVVGARVGGWCGLDGAGSLRAAVRARRRRHHDLYDKLDAEKENRAASLYRAKENVVVPPPQVELAPAPGLACRQCAPLSRDSWQDSGASEADSVINILDLGRQRFAGGGVISRYLCDIAHCLNLIKYDYKNIIPEVTKNDEFQKAIDKATKKLEDGRGDSEVQNESKVERRRVEQRALAILRDISSAMSNNVLRLVAWLCHKVVPRAARGGCGVRRATAARLRAASASGTPLVLVPLHRSHFDYVLVTLALYLTGVRPPLVAAGDNLKLPFFGWALRGCGAFFIKRRTEDSEGSDNNLYKAALRGYIIESLTEKNNLEFFIEGGRTRTGKPQTPKAGILSVIIDAYLDGKIDDALLVPVSVNYDRLVDGNFVREQIGMPKKMETFWSALLGIWRTMNTDHGSIRVHFNQPISLKEMITSFQRYSHLKTSVDDYPLNNNTNMNLDRQILYNQSNSSLYGPEVSIDHKIMVEAVGRHLVYDAMSSTPLMSTNVASYVLLCERRKGCVRANLSLATSERAKDLLTSGAHVAYAGDDDVVLAHALNILGNGLVKRERLADGEVIRARHSIPAHIELAYYANSVVAYYAPVAIVATALEYVVVSAGGSPHELRHTQLMSAALELCATLSLEFVICAPCQRLEERMADAISTLTASGVISQVQHHDGLEEQRWSRRFARNLEEDWDEAADSVDPCAAVTYTLATSDHAIAERRRLLLTLRPLLEAYSGACRHLTSGPQRRVVAATLAALTEDFSQNRMPFGEAVSTDAILNCHRLLKHWGVIELYKEGKERAIRLRPPYDDPRELQDLYQNIYKFNMESPLLSDISFCEREYATNIL